MTQASLEFTRVSGGNEIVSAGQGLLGCAQHIRLRTDVKLTTVDVRVELYSFNGDI